MSAEPEGTTKSEAPTAEVAPPAKKKRKPAKAAPARKVAAKPAARKPAKAPAKAAARAKPKAKAPARASKSGRTGGARPRR